MKIHIADGKIHIDEIPPLTPRDATRLAQELLGAADSIINTGLTVTPESDGTYTFTREGGHPVNLNHDTAHHLAATLLGSVYTERAATRTRIALTDNIDIDVTPIQAIRIAEIITGTDQQPSP